MPPTIIFGLNREPGNTLLGAPHQGSIEYPQRGRIPAGLCQVNKVRVVKERASVSVGVTAGLEDPHSHTSVLGGTSRRIETANTDL
jgi:hypothetical protein